MLQILFGIVLLGATAALLYPFIPAEGEAPKPRAEWIDVSVAIGVSAGLALGVGFVVGGAVALWL
jgi:hypothetical protein